MREDPNRRDERRRDPNVAAAPAADAGQAMDASIRHAFLIHMGEQQRQFAGAVMAATRRPAGAVGVEPRRR
jgi:hypothetical protein